jgi:VIT1/CCC1 family predicted Fe2+/Mn2+ transporter
MALTFTLGAGILTQREEMRSLVVAMIGCNVAWGVIDGALYLIGSVFSRNQRIHFVRKLRQTTSEAEAMAAIREEFGLEDEPDMPAEDRAAFHRVIPDIMRHARTERARLRPKDFQAAAIIAALVALTALPGIVPFLVLSDGYLALRSANVIQLCLLFLVGFRWARHTGSNPWGAGLAIAGLCIGLVAVSVALGG